MQVAIPIYDDFTALDAIGPYEVLSRIPGARVRFIAEREGPHRTDNGMLEIVAETTLDQLTDPEVVCVPGGVGTRREMANGPLVDWIRAAHESSQWTTSVCTGSLLLGAAGILEGLEATTHWLELETLRELGAVPTEQRVVEQGKVVTAAGVSAGIDMGLLLAARISGYDDVARTIQLGIEYDPQPPFDAGSPAKAPAGLAELVRASVAERERAASAGP